MVNEAHFAMKTLKNFWQNYGSKIYLRQNYPSMSSMFSPFLLHHYG